MEIKNRDVGTIIVMALFFSIMLSSCKKEDENHHKTIEIINYSEKDIYSYFNVHYPDTLALRGVPSSSEPSIYKVERHKSNTTALWQRTFWEVIFRDGRRIPSDTLMIFVMDAELLESKNTHINNAIIQRYDLSLQDLQQINWTLTYPPNESMKNIKMYPSYK